MAWVSHDNWSVHQPQEREYCWDEWRRLDGSPGQVGPHATIVMNRDQLPVAGFHRVRKLSRGYLAICACTDCRRDLAQRKHPIPTELREVALELGAPSLFAGSE